MKWQKVWGLSWGYIGVSGCGKLSKERQRENEAFCKGKGVLSGKVGVEFVDVVSENRLYSVPSCFFYT